MKRFLSLALILGLTINLSLQAFAGDGTTSTQSNGSTQNSTSSNSTQNTTSGTQIQTTTIGPIGNGTTMDQTTTNSSTNGTTNGTNTTTSGIGDMSVLPQMGGGKIISSSNQSTSTGSTIIPGTTETVEENTVTNITYSGNQVSSSSTTGSRTTTIYDNTGRVISSQTIPIGSPDRYVRSYQYYATGEVSEILTENFTGAMNMNSQTWSWQGNVNDQEFFSPSQTWNRSYPFSGNGQLP